MPAKDFFGEVLARLPKATRDAISARTAEMLEEDAGLGEHEFSLVLAGIGDLDDELMDALHEAGCDDATPGLRDGEVVVTFARAAATRREAILSAIRDISGARICADILSVDDCQGPSPMRPTPPARP
jgi:hypothetical protein